MVNMMLRVQLVPTANSMCIAMIADCVVLFDNWSAAIELQPTLTYNAESMCKRMAIQLGMRVEHPIVVLNNAVILCV
jgi:hypothetical protein